jgi:alpha-galactosidase
MKPNKIVVIGAGSASFGLNTLGALMNSRRLAGSHIALVDRNPETLQRIYALAGRLNREWDAQMTLSCHPGHAEALEGADFVVSAIVVQPRERLWRSDFEIPLRYGVRQPYAENGGPGGFANAARNIGPVLEIAHAMEEMCPEAYFINYSNPMMRICDAVHRYSKIKAIGLCHQIYFGYYMVGYLLSDYLKIDLPAFDFVNARIGRAFNQASDLIVQQTTPKIEIQAAGLNHFTWMLGVHDKRTGEDLYPLVVEHWKKCDRNFEPLTQRMVKIFGLMPIAGDGHLCEYLPWLSDPITKPWEKYHIHSKDWDDAEQRRDDGNDKIARMAAGELPVDELRKADSEGALEVIENISRGGNHYHLAANLPNQGYIPNLPDEAIVEVPAVFSGAGAQGVGVGPLPKPIAELLRREITGVQLAVDAAVHGDRQAALQYLLLDPVVNDIEVAQQILDDYLVTYRSYLAAFWPE